MGGLRETQGAWPMEGEQNALLSLSSLSPAPAHSSPQNRGGRPHTPPAPPRRVWSWKRRPGGRAGRGAAASPPRPRLGRQPRPARPRRRSRPLVGGGWVGAGSRSGPVCVCVCSPPGCVAGVWARERRNSGVFLFHSFASSAFALAPMPRPPNVAVGGPGVRGAPFRVSPWQSARPRRATVDEPDVGTRPDDAENDDDGGQSDADSPAPPTTSASGGSSADEAPDEASTACLAGPALFAYYPPGTAPPALPSVLGGDRPPPPGEAAVAGRLVDGQTGRRVWALGSVLPDAALAGMPADCSFSAGDRLIALGLHESGGGGGGGGGAHTTAVLAQASGGDAASLASPPPDGPAGREARSLLCGAGCVPARGAAPRLRFVCETLLVSCVWERERGGGGGGGRAVASGNPSPPLDCPAAFCSGAATEAEAEAAGSPGPRTPAAHSLSLSLSLSLSHANVTSPLPCLHTGRSRCGRLLGALCAYTPYQPSPAPQQRLLPPHRLAAWGRGRGHRRRRRSAALRAARIRTGRPGVRPGAGRVGRDLGGGGGREECWMGVSVRTGVREREGSVAVLARERPRRHVHTTTAGGTAL